MLHKEHACTTKSIVSAFDSAGIVRKPVLFQNAKNISEIKITLTVDKSHCRAVRHYENIHGDEEEWKNVRVSLEDH